MGTSDSSASPGLTTRKLAALRCYFDGIVEKFIPDSCREDPDRNRHARLIVHFGIQGAAFGAAYAIFYGCIGHFLGVRVILVCSAIFLAAPWFLRRTGSLGLAGHLLVGTMAAGFTQLSLIEGGIHSHAIAWLASVPLCALLVMGVRPAAVWAVVCFAVGMAIAGLTLCGLDLAPLYDTRWRDLIDAAGNLGIIIFLFILGLVFEVSRATAFETMRASINELLASNEELAHLNNEKTDFLDIAAHDLRNPLGVIIGMADLLRLGKTANPTSDIGRQIARSGRRMLEMINDLLDSSAIDQGRYAGSLEPIELRTLVQTSVQQLHTAAERKQITVETVPGPPCMAKVDRKATLQIFDNLISNALKYSPRGTKVTLTLETMPEWVEFGIKDQGPGISVDDQKKLFKKHTRLSAKPTGGESSVGLGLSIVKRVAEAMGGAVFCESTLGSGAKFMVRLQRAESVFDPAWLA